MAMRKRTNNDLQTIQRPWEKEQIMIYKQYNDHEKKNKWWSTNNTMAMRKRTNNDLQTIQWAREKEQIMIYKQYNGYEKKNK
jgi:hypothetical protein